MPRRSPQLVAIWASLALLCAVDAKAAEDFDDTVIADIRYPDWFKESFLDLPGDLSDARDAGKQGLFLFFSTQGCSYCHLFLTTSLADPELVARLRAHFDSIGLEIFEDAELVDFDGESTRVNAFALDQGVQFAPTLLFYDLDGQRLLRLTGYYEPERFALVLDYLIGGHYREEPWRAWLARREAASPQAAATPSELIADPLFADPPYALDRSQVPADRPLLVIFERRDCTRCPRFHAEVLADSEVRAALQGFEVVRLDADDPTTPVLAPSGERTNPAAWADALGFTQHPALAFFDEGGRAVLTSDALILKSRMMNSIGFVTERAFERGWTYQRFARSRAMARGAAEPDSAD